MRFSPSSISLLAVLLLPQLVQGQATQSSKAAVHVLESEDQYGPNDLHVLVPDHLTPGKKYAVVYVLPVYPGPKPPAAAIAEAQKLDQESTP